jgi:hypothetical protein
MGPFDSWLESTFIAILVLVGLPYWFASLRLGFVARRYEKLRKKHGGRSFRGINWNAGRDGRPGSGQPPALTPLLFVVVIAVAWAIVMFRDPYMRSLQWAVVYLAGLAVYASYLRWCGWQRFAGVRRELIRGALSWREDELEEHLLAALTHDPDVREQARLDTGVIRAPERPGEVTQAGAPPGARPVTGPRTGAAKGPTEAPTPRFSDAPPPL